MHSRARDRNIWKNVASTRTQGRFEEAQLSSGYGFRSDKGCPQVIKYLCGNLGICLNYYASAYFQSRNSVRVLSAAEYKRCFFKSRFSGGLLEQLIRFRERHPFQSWNLKILFKSATEMLSTRMRLMSSKKLFSQPDFICYTVYCTEKINQIKIPGMVMQALFKTYVQSFMSLVERRIFSAIALLSPTIAYGDCV